MTCKQYRGLLVLGAALAVLLASAAGASSAPADSSEAPPPGEKGPLPEYADAFRATFEQYDWSEPEEAMKHLEDFLGKTPQAQPYNALKYFADQKAVDLLVMVLRYPVRRQQGRGTGPELRRRAMTKLTSLEVHPRHIPAILGVVEWTMGSFHVGIETISLLGSIRMSARVVLERSTRLDFGGSSPMDPPVSTPEMVRVTREWYGNYVKEHPEDFPPSTDEPTTKTGEPTTNGRPPRNPTPPIATAPTANDDSNLWPIWLGALALCALVAAGALYLRRKRAA